FGRIFSKIYPLTYCVGRTYCLSCDWRPFQANPRFAEHAPSGNACTLSAPLWVRGCADDCATRNNAGWMQVGDDAGRLSALMGVSRVRVVSHSLTGVRRVDQTGP